MQKEKGDVKWKMERLFKEIRVEIKIEGLKRLNRERVDKGEIMWVKVKKEIRS